MQVKSTLSLTTTATQRLAVVPKVEFSPSKPLPQVIPVRASNKESFFTVLVKSAAKPLRIPVPVIAAHPLLAGNRPIMRVLR